MRSGLRLAGWAGLSCLSILFVLGVTTSPDPQTVAALEEFFGKRRALSASPQARPMPRKSLERVPQMSGITDDLTTSSVQEDPHDDFPPFPPAFERGPVSELRLIFEDDAELSIPAPRRLVQVPAEMLTLLAAAPDLEDIAAAFDAEGETARPFSAEGRTARRPFQDIVADGKSSTGSGNGLSMPQALALAYQNNPEINAARAELRALGESVPQAQAAMRPFVSGTVEASSEFSGASLNGSLIQADKLDLGLELNQKLFDGFQTSNNVSAARAQVSAARKNLANQEQNVLYSAATAYMDTLRDRQITALRRQNMSFLDEQVRAAEARFELGEATRTDVAQAKSQRELAAALLSSALAELEAREALFERITGTAPKELRPASVPKALLPRSLKEAQAIAQRDHPSILANRFTADAAAALARSAQGAFLPSVNLTASLNDSFALNAPSPALPSSNDPDSEEVKATVGVKLTIPLFQGGGAASRARQAREAVGQRRIEADGARLRVRADVSTAWAQLQAAKANVSGFQARVTAAQLALEGVIEEQSVGQRTTLDVLNANDQVVSGQILLLGAQRNLVVTSYALVSAVGHLSAEKARSAPSSNIVRKKKRKDDWQRMR